MKKLMVLIGAVAILLSACADSPKESDEPPKAEQPGDITLPEGKTFREVIENAKDNEVIDLRNFSGEDSAYKVRAKNVMLKNANLPDATIVVSDAIGDADFTLENCNFHSLLVEGGGSNSVHILGGSIRSLVVSKKGVRVRFEQKVRVETVNVEVDCVLDADAAENTVGSIYITPTVKSVEIGKDGNAAISIGEMKFNVAEGDAKSSSVKVQLGNDKIKIEKASETIKDKITNSNNEKVDIGGSVEDDKYVKEIPLDISFFKDSDISFDVDGGDTVEAESSMSNGEAAIKNTSAATDKTLWSSYALMKIPYKGEKGSSYNVKLSLKADKDCSVVVGVRDAMLGVEAGPTYCFTVSKEWKEVEIPTGALFEDWSGYAHLSIGVGDASTVYAKNLKIEKTEDSEFPVSIVYNTKEDIGGVTVSKNEDAAYVIQNKAGAKNGVNLFYGVVGAGKFYKVSFDVTTDADGAFLNVWGHTFHDDYETSGSGSFEFKKDTPKHIDLYLPCNTVTSKNGSITVEKCVGQLWIGCKDDKAHSIKVSGIKYAESSIEEAKSAGLDLHVAGEIVGVEGSWTAALNSAPVTVPSGKTFKGQLVLCDDKNWLSTEHAVTSFRGISAAAKGLGLKHSADDENNLYYENTSGSDQEITLSIDEATFEVNMSVEDVKEFPLTIERLPYDSVKPNDEESDNTEAKFSLNDDGEATITNTSTVADKTLWSSFALIKMPYQGKKGSGYNVKLSLKADKECVVAVGVRDAMLGSAGPTSYFTLSDEWKEVEIPTGVLFEDWSEYAHLSIGVGDASTVYAKNLKIEKVEEPEFPVHVVYEKKEDVGSVEVTTGGDDYTINYKKSASAGVNLFYGVVEAGKFYKVSFDITADADGQFLDIWGHTFHNAYETSGSESLVFESGKPKHIDLYLPCYAASLKNGNVTSEKHVGQIWIGCNDGDAHSIKVSGIKYAESSIAEAKSAGLDLYVAGEILGVEGSWTAALNSAPVTVPSRKTFKGQLVLCDASNWGSEEHAVTSFRGISAAAKKLGLKHIPSDENELYYENTSDSDQTITLSIDEKTFEVNMSVK